MSVFHRYHQKLSPRLAIIALLMASVAITSPTFAAVPNTVAPPVDEQVDFQATSVLYDEVSQIITAEGQVEIAQAGSIVKSDKIIYNLPQDKVEAVGNVVMMDKSGDVHFADRAELKTKLKDGYIKKLKSILADGSRITAAEGQKTGGKTVMKDASYTPCEECKTNPDKPVMWQIVADEVTHDKDNHSVEYKNAQFEVYGVPIAYVPYFSHSDGTIKQQSGFLTPKLSLNSQLGFGLESRYYWAIDPSEDATIGAKVFSKNIPQLTGEYRKRYDNAAIKFASSATYSNDNDDTESDKKARGHLFGTGLWDIDDKWRSGFDLQLSSDDTYLREFDITRDNVLQNQIYAERFDNRDYFSARAFAFQDVRVSDRSVDQPNILPEIQASFIGNPNETIGGRWNLDFSSLNLLRDGSGQDILRGSVNVEWQRRDVSSFGLVNTLNISMRGDAYDISDGDLTSTSSGGDKENAFRFYPVIHDVVSYPISKNIGTSQVVIEPTVAFTTSTKTKNDGKIPNEDSQDVQIDTTNIFEANRFPGLDRVEDKSHVTYGTRVGVYAADGSKGEIFLGQSYRFDNDSNPFPEGSGLSEQESDVVGQIAFQYQNLYDLNYRFQLGSDNFQSERHELDAFAGFGRLSLNGTYLYARRLERTDIQDSRQQIYGASTYAFDEEWSLLSNVRYDLSEEEKGLRYAGLGINYSGQCFNILTSLRRSYADKETGDNATEFSIQLGLKNIGTFGTDQ